MVCYISHYVHVLMYDGKLHMAPLKKDIKVRYSLSFLSHLDTWQTG